MKSNTKVELIRVGAIFAIISALMYIQPLASEAYLKLFYEKGEMLIQPPIAEGLPIPANLVWSNFGSTLVQGIGTFPIAAVLGWYIGFGCILGYLLIRILNPTFKMTSGVDWDHTVLTKTYMHTPPLIKAFLIIVTFFLPVFIFWQVLVRVFGDNVVTLLIRSSVIGSLFWTLMHRDGVAGEFEYGSYEIPHAKSVLSSLIKRGALAGFLVGILLEWGPVGYSTRMFEMYRAIGGVGEAEFWSIVATCLLWAALIGATCSTIAIGLGAPGLTMRTRTKCLWLSALLMFAIILGNRVAAPAYWRSAYRYDKTSTSTSDQLKQLLNISPTSAVPQTVVAVRGSQIRIAHLTGRSITELPADPKTAQKIEKYLAESGYSTGLSYATFVTLQDAASLAWDVAGPLRVSMENITHRADPGQMRMFLDKIQFAAVTPEVLKYADLFASDKYMQFPDRKSQVYMGDVFAQLGQIEKAQSWYRKAELPNSQVIERSQERSRFVNGKITGQVMVDEKPVAGLKIGIMTPAGANLVQDLTDPKGITSPFWLSWIAASSTTGTNGTFTLDHLPQGAYTVVVQIPANLDPTHSGFVITGIPRAVFIDSNLPTVNLQKVTIHTRK